ncbi:Ubiquitin--protein ligase [Bertholletia excelsa]
MEPSSSRNSRSTVLSRTSRRKFISRRIEPAIRGKSCPICLRRIEDRSAAVITACFHAYCVGCIRRWSDLKRKCPLCNADFDAWFFRINLASRTFLRQQVPALGESKKANLEAVHRRRRDFVGERRVLRRSREELNCVSRQTRPLPRRRWFSTTGSESPDAVADRIIRWRASIYDQQLQAVPYFPSGYLDRKVIGNNGTKEGILKRIEPWIRRELQAITGDPDPSIIVHVASSLFISSLGEECKIATQQAAVENNYLEPLHPFLHEKTTMFWHELRCFAGSPFNMETYDTVVEYKKLLG